MKARPARASVCSQIALILYVHIKYFDLFLMLAASSVICFFHLPLKKKGFKKHRTHKDLTPKSFLSRRRSCRLFTAPQTLFLGGGIDPFGRP